MTLTHMKLNYGLWEHLVLIYVAVLVQSFDLGFGKRDAESAQPVDKLLHVHMPLEKYESRLVERFVGHWLAHWLVQGHRCIRCCRGQAP